MNGDYHFRPSQSNHSIWQTQISRLWINEMLPKWVVETLASYGEVSFLKHFVNLNILT